ncbi:hypothetical protein BLA29_005869 [Euroglyphus maynei]|uniref:Uncharacterized protein n=1 Tax=Euroglyphus maynei TaxID=6958 RepID=A0A1Y3AN98_EURMA|nr:hypothetical protein BLA29_005869 [Euroglyphus maynei]
MSDSCKPEYDDFLHIYELDTIVEETDEQLMDENSNNNDNENDVPDEIEEMYEREQANELY